MLRKRIYFILVSACLFIPNLAFAILPNDPEASQWAYQDTGVYTAWDKTTGSNRVVVAIIDNGFDTYHPDIFPNVWKNDMEVADNGLDDDGNGYVDDMYGWNFVPTDTNGDGRLDGREMLGNNDPRPPVFDVEDNKKNLDTLSHGTVVAGIIGAVGNNRLDGAGINWNVRLMNIRVAEASGTGYGNTVARAIRYAADNGADVINMSLVGDKDANTKLAIQYAFRKGVAMVAAAGNGGVDLNKEPLYPICADAGESEQWILGVSSISQKHTLSTFSNGGASCIDITAPGEGIGGTVRYAPMYGLDSQFINGWRGTSFSSAMVSGAAALVKSIEPSWKAPQIYEALLSTTHRTPSPDPVLYKQAFGAGLLQVNKAIDYAVSNKISTVSDLLGLAVVGSKKNIQTVKLGTFEVSVPKLMNQFDSIATYNSQDGLLFVGIKKENQSKFSVTILNKDGALINSWSFKPLPKEKISGRLIVYLADVLKDSAPEIIVSPEGRDTVIFRIFDTAGHELKRAEMKAVHAGVSLAFGHSTDVKKQTMYSLYLDKGKLLTHEYDSNFNVVNTYHVTYLKSSGTLAIGDVDGDGAEDAIVAGGLSEPPILAYYNSHGELQREFNAYDPSNTSGLRLAVGDYNHDGKDDVMVAVRDGKQAARVWNYRAQRMGEWFPFGENGGPIRDILPMYTAK